MLWLFDYFFLASGSRIRIWIQKATESGSISKTLLFGQAPPKPYQNHHLGFLSLLMEGSRSGLLKTRIHLDSKRWLLLIFFILSVFIWQFFPPGSGSAYWIPIRILEWKLNRVGIHSPAKCDRVGKLKWHGFGSRHGSGSRQ